MIHVSGDTRQDYNWGWGESGDGGLTSFALNSVYQIRRMHDYFVNIHNGGNEQAGVKISRLTITPTKNGSIAGTHIYLGGSFAMSSDIALHEYTHGAMMLPRGSGMQIAMSEGFADFFPTDVTDDNMFGGPIRGNSDPILSSHESGVTTRFVFNECTQDHFHVVEFPCGQVGSDYNSTNWHNTGRIISGVIWRIRQGIKSEAAIMLYKALKLLGFDSENNSGYANQTFQDLRTRYEAVDKMNENSNAELIEDQFTIRKIGGPCMPTALNIREGSNQAAIVLWRDNSWVEDGYVVETSGSTSGYWSVIARLPSGSTQYTDVRPGCIGYKPITRYYRVAAYKAYGSSTSRGEGSDYIYGTSSDTLWTYSPDRAFQPETCGHTNAAKKEETHKTESSEARSDDTRPIRVKIEAYPSPFNPITTVRFTLRERSKVQLEVFDMLGRPITKLVDDLLPYGSHTVRFDGSNLASGAYILRLTAPKQQRSIMVHLVK